MRETLYFLLFLFASTSSFAQIKLVLIGDVLPSEISAKEVHRDSTAVQSYCESLIFEIHSEGYVAASIDSIFFDSEEARATFHLGAYYPVVNKRAVSNLNVDLKNPSRGPTISNRRTDAIASKQILDELDQQGYPFAEVTISHSPTLTDTLYRDIQVNPGPLVRIDSVIVRSEFDISYHTICRHIGVRPGRPYDGKMLSRVDARLAELPFLTVGRPSEVIFSGNSARLLVFLKDRKADRIDAIIGFQPGDDGSTVLTGEVDLGLVNAFNRAEEISLKWQRVKDDTQELEVGLSYPYIFRSAFGIEAGLEIFRQDTTFNELRARLGLGYVLDNGDRLSLYIRTTSYSSLLENVGSEMDLGANSLQYGVGLSRRRFNRPYNPSRGIGFDVLVSTGEKSFSRPINSESVPPTTDEVTYEGEGDIRVHLPVGKTSTVLFRGRGGSRTGADLLSKELYRLGGLRSLRGFDEQSILASSYVIFTAEYRFITGPESFFSAFYDQGLLETNTIDDYTNDTPYGFGVGMSLGTKSGIFSLNYALGSRFDAPIELRSGKIHFGYIATF